jgi:hypothetical protein
MPPESIALITLAIKAALAPLQERSAALAEKCAHLEASLAAVAPELMTLRERAAVLETRAPIAGPPGAAGADGFSADELTVSQDAEDDRLVTLGYRRGDVTKTIGTLRLSTPRYCGVYDQTRVYTKGDQVTYTGSLWVCQATTRTRPGGPEDGWTLQVKRGEAR